jgi:hypothetical protein
MTEAKRYWADMVPLVWDSEGVGKVQEVYLASDYDALLAKARRLRAALIDEQEDDYNDNCFCTTCALLRETADLEVTP